MAHGLKAHQVPHGEDNIDTLGPSQGTERDEFRASAHVLLIIQYRTQRCVSMGILNMTK